MSILHVPITASNEAEWKRRASGAINQLIKRGLVVDTVTAAATLDHNNDIVLCNATAAAFSVTLPKAGGYKGRPFYIKKIDASANAVTIDGNGSETIDGAATDSLSTQWESRTVVSDGSNWLIL